MVSELRQEYNAKFTAEKYSNFLNWIGKTYDWVPPFKISETPVFVDRAFKQKLFDACDSISKFLLDPSFKSYSNPALIPEFTVPNETDHTIFLQMDFGICRGADGVLNPQLIEVQGFPSLYFYQDFAAEAYRRFFDIPDNYSHLFNGMTRQQYLDLLKRVIVGNANPKNVVLLEVDPFNQPTAIDFVIAKKILGIEVLCISDVKKSGKNLYYLNDAGQKVDIERIYNRVIFDDLIKREDLSDRAFQMTDEVDVHWVGHPNWFYRISKHTLPLLDSPFVPPSFLLDQMTSIPKDLHNYVLKPLFSFSGSGVKINITADDINAIEDPANYMLQKKVQYEPVIQTPDVPAKCEIRMLMMWEEGTAGPVIINNLARLSKGEMIGVKYNRGLDWVGGSVGFFEE